MEIRLWNRNESFTVQKSTTISGILLVDLLNVAKKEKSALLGIYPQLSVYHKICTRKISVHKELN